MQEEVLMTNAAANYLNIWNATLRVWADRGKIPCTKDRRGWRYFKKSDLDKIKKELEK